MFKRKMKIILISVVMSVVLITGIGLTIPGMGIESLKFINSVKDQLNVNFAKGKFVLDGKSKLFKYAVNTSIKSSYVADALSSTNWYDQEGEGSPEKIAEYTEFAENWFEETWGQSRDNGTDIDLNDVSMDLIEFDQAFAAKFHNFGYVNPGITWIFKKDVVSNLLDPNFKASKTYTDAIHKQTILDQELYESKLDFTGPGINGIKVTNSIGSNIVNNKVWFINIQRENVKFAMTNPIGKVFKNKDLTVNDLPKVVTVDDLYKPNFAQGLEITKAGVIVLLIIAPIFLISGTVLLVYVIKKDRKESK